MYFIFYTYVDIRMYKKQLTKRTKSRNSYSIGGKSASSQESHFAILQNISLCICPAPAGSELDFAMSFLEKSLKVLG